MTVAIIMTVFNRLDKTKRCLNDLEIALKDTEHVYYITNDGSTDGTAEYLGQLTDIDCKIYNGTGDLFWNRGMYFSYENALKNKYDFYLWVNNDTTFYSNAWEQLMNDYSAAKRINEFAVIGGSVQSEVSKEATYGGTNEKGLISPTGKIVECTHINGNCLLIPSIVAQKIGNLDFRFEHGLGDFDYGQRILSAGGKLYASSMFVGTCEKNKVEGTWKDKNLSPLKRISLMRKKTGQPRKSYRIYLRKWNKKNWLLYYYKPYFDIWMDAIKSLLSKEEYR